MSRILIVEAQFYEAIADELGKGAIAVLEEAGMEFDRIGVPGALEIPAAIAIASQRTDGVPYAAYIALGCVIRGETSHYDYVCGESMRGLQNLALSQGLCIGNGILTVEDKEQAWVRAAVDKKNKGKDAAQAALALLALKRRFGVE